MRGSDLVGCWARLAQTVGGGLYLAGVTLIGFGLGALIRHTAGALSTLFGLLFATSALVNLLPGSWADTVLRYLLVNAGTQILTRHQRRTALPPCAGLGVLRLYAAIATILAATLNTRRHT